jgi:hypothetical protein
MVRPLPIRGDRVADNAVVVIRAGVMNPASVQRAASRTFDIYGLLGISVEAVLDQTVLDACRGSERLALYSKIRLSTFGRLRAADFAILSTFDSPHFTIVLPDLSELTLTRLGRSFDDPIANPARGRDE